MNSSPVNIVAALLAQHASEQTAIDTARAAEPVVTITFSPNPPAKIKAKKVTAPDNTGKSAIPGIFGLPDKGSLDAAGFMAAYRTAGKRPNSQGVLIPVPSEKRTDVIKAIHGYFWTYQKIGSQLVKVPVGYDARGNFGQQEQAALALAAKELGVSKVTAGKDRAEVKSAARSLAGFVAGVPDSRGKYLANLLAQREVIVEAIATYTAAQADDKVMLEEERLSHLNAQLEAMGYHD